MKRLLCLLAVLVAILAPQLVHAQSNQNVNNGVGLNLEISPPRQILVGQQGKKLDSPLSIRNRNAGTESLRLDIMRVRAQGDQLFLDTPPKDDLFVNWVKFNTKIPFDAPYDKWIKVPISIDIPKDAAFGYYYAILISRATAPQVQPGTTQSIEGKIAQFILLDVQAPGAQRTAVISEFSTDRRWYEFLPVNFKTVVTNTGNVHVAPKGNIFIKNMTGHQVASLELNSESGNILPKGNRTFPATWDDGFPRYETVNDQKKLVWHWNQLGSLRFGRYIAQAVLVYNDGSRDIPITNSTSFWVIPWRILIAVLLVLFFIITGIILILRSIWRLIDRRRKKQQDQKTEENTDEKESDNSNDSTTS